MSKMMVFFSWILKVSLAITLAAIFVICIIWGYNAFEDRRYEKKLESIKDVVVWDTLTVKSQNATFLLKTKYDGNIKYQLDVGFKGGRSIPDFSEIIIILHDNDRFELERIVISGKDLSLRIDDGGKPIGYRAAGESFMVPDVYRKIKGWNISWRMSN